MSDTLPPQGSTNVALPGSVTTVYNGGRGIDGSVPVALSAFPAAVGGEITLSFATSGNILYSGIITAETTFELSGGSLAELQQLSLLVGQDDAGGRIIEFAAGVLWENGTVPSPSLASGAYNLYTFVNTGIPGVYIGTYVGVYNSPATGGDGLPFDFSIAGNYNLALL